MLYFGIFHPCVSSRTQTIIKLKKPIFAVHTHLSHLSVNSFTQGQGFHAHTHMNTALCGARTKINGAEMSLKVKRCLWNCKWESKNVFLLNWSALFCVSLCNLLICQIFTHEQFYCPLWATACKLCWCGLFQSILSDKKIWSVEVWWENNSLKAEKSNGKNINKQCSQLQRKNQSPNWTLHQHNKTTI